MPELTKSPAEVLGRASDWGPGGKHVVTAAKGLTKAERVHVLNGCISGDFRMSTVRSLESKAMFYLKIDSPNGRCGFMTLTPLGENVQALLKSRQASRRGGEA